MNNTILNKYIDDFLAAYRLNLKQHNVANENQIIDILQNTAQDWIESHKTELSLLGVFNKKTHGKYGSKHNASVFDLWKTNQSNS